MLISQCAYYIGMSYETLNSYRLHLQDEVFYRRQIVGVGIGNNKKVGIDVSYFSCSLQAKTWSNIQNGQQMDEDDVYHDPQKMLEDIENGKLHYEPTF